MLDGGLNRGPECGKGYIDRISLARYLKQGENTLRLMVWYWGNEGRNNEDSGHGGLYFQMEIDGETRLVSDHTWAARLLSLIHISWAANGEKGTGSLHIGIIDALSQIGDETIEKRGQISYEG